ncbi:MAG: hypothetical protein M1830_009793 [Pleopsidium flavum]|nr:MAG: hypothetical protein M1830_009793 [Pleopsidium flavum]
MSYLFRGLHSDALPLFPLGWSVLWAIISTIYLFSRKRPIHPGAVVANDLITWLSIVALGTFTVIGAVCWNYFGRMGYVVCDNEVKAQRLHSSEYCNPARRTAGLCELAGISLMAASLVTHFALFVWACREVDVRRKGKTKRDIELQYPGYQMHKQEGTMKGHNEEKTAQPEPELSRHPAKEGLYEERTGVRPTASERSKGHDSPDESDGEKGKYKRAQMWNGFKGVTMCLAA